MPDGNRIAHRIVDRFHEDRSRERDEVIDGLRATPAWVSPKYFYDELGCALYGAICRLPEYYPTRTEVALFQAKRDEIAEAVGSRRQFVDLGAGDCCKGQAWLPFVQPRRYLAVDIARSELEKSLARMAPDFPEVEMLGVVSDFTRGLPLDDVLDAGAATFFYPGSSIGNFTPADATVFLGTIQRHCAVRPGSGLLIGVDGKKAKAVLDAAYDDALGVTAAFNRNVLSHLNRRFGFDFAIEGFRHVGFYDEDRGRIEMHLESVREQTVLLGGAPRRFASGERIHTENSYKYSAGEFEALLRGAGFDEVRRWADPSGGYFVFYAS